MEKIQISNFAGLRDVELEVSRVTGLIGPEASGKSIIARLLYFFREMASLLPQAVMLGRESGQYNAECRERFQRYFPIGSGGAADFDITYTNTNTTGSEHVRVKFCGMPAARQDALSLEWSEFYPRAMERLKRRRDELFGSLEEGDEYAAKEARTKLIKEYDGQAREVLGPWSSYEQMFIPAGRAFFSQVQASIFTTLHGGESPDPFLAAFGSLLELTKPRLDEEGFYDLVKPDAFQAIRPSIKEILHAELGRAKGQEFLQFGDGRRVKLAQVSSGQQEALPIVRLLALIFSTSNWRGRALYIEEPEPHLFPSTQKQIVELIGSVFRARKDELCLVVTTHSPYILTSFNNLLQAGKLWKDLIPKGDTRTAWQLSRTIRGSFDPGEVCFYALEEGRARPIMDPGTGLIDASYIDQVSNDIAIEFDQLLAEGNEKP
jgi:hypothetical protein